MISRHVLFDCCIFAMDCWLVGCFAVLYFALVVRLGFVEIGVCVNSEAFGFVYVWFDLVCLLQVVGGLGVLIDFGWVSFAIGGFDFIAGCFLLALGGLVGFVVCFVCCLLLGFAVVWWFLLWVCVIWVCLMGSCYCFCFELLLLVLVWFGLFALDFTVGVC